MVIIRNKKTGEVKEVPDNQLPYYGINPQGEIQQKIYEREQLLPGELEETSAKAEIDKQKQLEIARLKMEQEYKFKQEHPELSAEEEKKLSLKKEVKERAQGVLDVLDKGEKGELKGKAFTDAINFAAGKYAAANAFGEGGKQFTETELAQLMGTLPTIEIKKQNILDRILGRVPPQTGRVLDNPETLRNKMLMATGQTPISTPGTQGLQRGRPIGGFQPSVGEFASNIQRDIGENIGGLLAIPGALGDILSGKIPPGEAAKAVGGGIAQEYGQLLTQPLQTGYEKPISTILNILPFLQAGKLAKAKYISKAGAAIKAPEEVSGIAKILSKAEQAKGIEKVSPMARNIYQGVLSISRRSNAFERLQPNETVGAMIKYGIKGNADNISTTTRRVTGSTGILSNIVNDAVGQIKKPIKLDTVGEVIADSKAGRYSALTKDKIDELGIRVANISIYKAPGQAEISKLLDFERQIQAEAVNHRIAGMRGDTAAMELSQLKFEVADEMGRLIDETVGQTGNLAKYKQAEVIGELKKISPRLADDFQKAETISDIRSLQKPFVRMSRILELAQNEPSGLGRQIFGLTAQFPILGPMLQAGAQEMAVPAATSVAVGMEKLSPLLRLLQRGVSPTQFPGPLQYILGRQYKEQTRPY